MLAKVDTILAINTDDLSQLLTLILLYNKECPINGITTTADFYVPQASFLAEQLALPAIKYKNALGVRNKYLMRQNLASTVSSLNPRFQLAFTFEQALNFAKKIGFPIVAKPQNGNDSLFVKKISNERELKEYFKLSAQWLKKDLNNSEQTYVNGILIEEFIDGQEYSVETVQFPSGNIQLIGVSKKEDFFGLNDGNFAELSVSFPVKTGEEASLFSAISKALAALGINVGVIHTECRIDSNGQVKIIEINPRLAGDMLGSHAIKAAIGVNPCEFIVEAALGNKLAVIPKKNGAAAVMGIHALKQGYFAGIANKADFLSQAGFVDMMIWTPEGTYLQVPSSNADLVGRFVTDGKDAAEAIQRARDIYKLIKVVTLNKNVKTLT